MPIVIPVDVSKLYQGEQSADNAHWQDARNAQNWDAQQMKNNFSFNTLGSDTYAKNNQNQYTGDEAVRKNDVANAQQGANMANAENNTDAANALRDYSITSGFFPNWAKANVDNSLNSAQSGAATSQLQNEQSQAKLNAANDWNTPQTTANAAAQQANIDAQQGVNDAVNKFSFTGGFSGDAVKNLTDDQISTLLHGNSMLPLDATIQNHQIIQPGLPPMDVGEFLDRNVKLGSPAPSAVQQQAQNNADLALYKAELKARTDAANNAERAKAKAAASSIGGITPPQTGTAPAQDTTAQMNSLMNGGSGNTNTGTANTDNNPLPQLPPAPTFGASGNGFVPLSFSFNTKPNAESQEGDAQQNSQPAPAAQPSQQGAQSLQGKNSGASANGGQPQPAQPQTSNNGAASPYPASLSDANAVYASLPPEQKQQIDAQAQHLQIAPQQLAGLQARQNWANKFRNSAQKLIDAIPDGRTKILKQQGLNNQFARMQQEVAADRKQIMTPSINAYLTQAKNDGGDDNKDNQALHISMTYGIPFGDAQVMVNHFYGDDDDDNSIKEGEKAVAEAQAAAQAKTAQENTALQKIADTHGDDIRQILANNPLSAPFAPFNRAQAVSDIYNIPYGQAQKLISIVQGAQNQ